MVTGIQHAKQSSAQGLPPALPQCATPHEHGYQWGGPGKNSLVVWYWYRQYVQLGKGTQVIKQFCCVMARQRLVLKAAGSQQLMHLV